MFLVGLGVIITTYMTPEEKIKKLQELQQKFMAELNAIEKEYTQKIKELQDIANKQKIENLKKDLGI